MGKPSNEGASQESAMPKRAKTGGRAKKSLDQQLNESDARDRMARYADETDVPPALAAIYLGISEGTLAELRKPTAPGEGGAEGPPFYKVAVPGARGSNQTPMYSMAGLRAYKKKNQGTNSHEVAVKTNMLGWVSAQEPFFAQLEARRQPTVLLARAWDFDEPDRDELFAKAARGEIRVVWMSPAEAAGQRWTSSNKHQAFAERWLELLALQSAAVRTAMEATEMHEETPEPEERRKQEGKTER